MRCLARFGKLINDNCLFKHFLLVDKPSKEGEDYFGTNPENSLIWLDSIISSRLNAQRYDITLCRIFEHYPLPRLIQHRLTANIWVPRLELNEFSTYELLPFYGSLAKFVFSRENCYFDGIGEQHKAKI